MPERKDIDFRSRTSSRKTSSERSSTISIFFPGEGDRGVLISRLRAERSSNSRRVFWIRLTRSASIPEAMTTPRPPREKFRSMQDPRLDPVVNQARHQHLERSDYRRFGP